MLKSKLVLKLVQFAIFLAGVFQSHSAFAIVDPTKPTPISQKIKIPVPAGYELAFHDEFIRDGLPDKFKWHIDAHKPAYNWEIQDYTSKLENLRVKNGRLIVEARKQNSNGKPFTSGSLTSKFHYDYGRLEFRARVPKGMGTWPAIWTLFDKPKYGNGGWPDNGEIDVMESFGYIKGTQSVLHFNTHSGLDETYILDPHPDLAENEFHTYTLDRTPDSLVISIDGIKRFEYDNPKTGWKDWPYDLDHVIIMNLAVGGLAGGQFGVDDKAFPQIMEVDYVRVFKKKSSP